MVWQAGWPLDIIPEAAVADWRIQGCWLEHRRWIFTLSNWRAGWWAGPWIYFLKLRCVDFQFEQLAGSQG
jgi:hypothetical protein